MIPRPPTSTRSGTLFPPATLCLSIEEQRVRAGLAAHALLLDQLGVVARLAHRLRMNLQAMLVGERENLDQPHRVGGEEIVRRQREPAAVEDEAVELARPPPQRRHKAPPARRQLKIGRASWRERVFKNV